MQQNSLTQRISWESRSIASIKHDRGRVGCCPSHVCNPWVRLPWQDNNGDRFDQGTDPCGPVSPIIPRTQSFLHQFFYHAEKLFAAKLGKSSLLSNGHEKVEKKSLEKEKKVKSSLSFYKRLQSVTTTDSRDLFVPRGWRLRCRTFGPIITRAVPGLATVCIEIPNNVQLFSSDTKPSASNFSKGIPAIIVIVAVFQVTDQVAQTDMNINLYCRSFV